MIAEVVPAAEDLATKAELHAVEAKLEGKLAELRVEMHGGFSSMKGWMIGVMIPLWVGVYGTLITLIVQK